MNFLQENEVNTNKLVLKALWVGSLFGFFITVVLNIIGMVKGETTIIIISSLIGLMTLLAVTGIYYCFPGKLFVKYFLMLGAIVTVGVPIALSGEGLQLSFLWFFVLAASSLYYNHVFTILITALVVVLNSFLVFSMPGYLIDLVPGDLLSATISFLISAFSLVFIVFQGRKFVDRVMFAEKETALFNKKMESLIGESQTVASEVSGISKTLSDFSQDINATVQEVASTTNVFAVSVQELASKSTEMAQTSSTVNNRAAQGQDEVEGALRQINNIQNVILEIQNSVEELVDKTKNIGKMIATIDEISSQTNLLALNAAIEAARAGEFGRGFAVVADEVRKLSEQVARSAKEISLIVAENEQKSDQTIKKISDGVKQVKEGATVIENAGASFKEIIVSVSNVIKNIEEIAAMGEELEASSENLASTSEQQSASVQEVSNMAGNLKDVIQKLENQLKTG